MKVLDAKIQAKLAEANERLRAANVGITILQRNNKLYLRGVLPPKDGKGKPKRQELATGVRASASGIRFAETEARKIGALVDCKEFSWETVSHSVRDEVVPPTVGEVVARFEEHYFQRRARTPQSETTWKDYQKIFRLLPPEEPMGVEVLLKVVLATAPDTRTRQRCCMVLTRLAKFAGVDLDVKPYQGSYSPKRVTPRHLPTDKEIAHWRNQIEHPAWRWAYGMMACYGLRNHEVFLVDPDSLRDAPGIVTLLEDKPTRSADGTVITLKGKTGARRVWPCYPK